MRLILNYNNFINSIVNLYRKRIRSKPQLSSEVLEQRSLLEKEWCRYKLQEHRRDAELIHNMIKAQQKALQELRLESEELYQAAMQQDYKLFPIKIDGPVATPPISQYDAPDGEYVNVSKKWE